ncbi:KR domain-containing protein [Streptomyces sp. NPDC029674]|uniref:KR domain-containing protein n=1 Tax=Streptomyces sp. NPDC029674 TaxID=3365297 RepID=UPI00384BCCED
MLSEKRKPDPEADIRRGRLVRTAATDAPPREPTQEPQPEFGTRYGRPASAAAADAPPRTWEREPGRKPESEPRAPRGLLLHHTPVWVPAATRPQQPSARAAARSLLIVDSRDTGRAWAPLGVRTVRVGRDISGSAPSWTAYLKGLCEAGHEPRVLVFDLPAATTTPERAAELVLPVLRALCGGSVRRDPLRLAFLVTGRARPELAAAFGAVAQVAGVEDGRLDAVSLGVQTLPSWAGDPFRLALAELALPRPGLGEVRYADTGREVRVLRAAPGPRPGAPAAALRTGGRYLVTDAGEGTGTRLALSLARRHRAHIVLLAPSHRPLPADARLVQARGRLARHDDVRAAVRTALHHFGGLDGVLHCADPGAARPLSRLSAAGARQALADTVTGAGHLDRATAELPLDFFASVTSAAAYRAGIGAAIPAAVGRALGALAADRARLAGEGLRRGVTVAASWPAGTDRLTALAQALACGRSELTVNAAPAR